jgi:hypothetical protein
MRDLSEVGRTKLVGYLPLSTIANVLRTTPEALAREAAACGSSALALDANET